MARTVKLFQSTLKYYQTLGIYHPLQPNKKYAFNLISLSILFSMIASFISTSSYFLFKAENIDESSKTFYVALTELNFSICFLVNIWKMEKIVQMILKAEVFIEKSMLFRFCSMLF